MNVSNLEDYVTPEEAAEQISRSVPSVYRYMEKGVLDWIWAFGKKVISRKSLQEFKEPQRGNPTFRKS